VTALPDELEPTLAELVAIEAEGLDEKAILDRLYDGVTIKTLARQHNATQAAIRQIGDDHGLTYGGHQDNRMYDPALRAPAVTWSEGRLTLLRDAFTDPGDEQEESWQDRALCAQTDPEAFFPEKGGSTRDAKRVCRSCEVRGECLTYALEHDERFGIWGGLSERERRRLCRQAV
jgi:WhiB family redox-sensing transcriptional regulator